MRDRTRAERALLRSLRQGARLFALRSATGLARFLVDRGDAARARPLLEDAIRGITQPTPTRDLDEARQTLAEISPAP